MKHVPERTCICCRRKFPKEQLIRIVRSGGKFFVDRSQKADGRGAYFCGSDECRKKLIKSHGLDRSFHQKVDDSVYELLCTDSTFGKS